METRRPVAIGTTLLGLVAIGAAAGMYGGGGGVNFGSTTGQVGGGQPDQQGVPAWVIEAFTGGFFGLMALVVLVGVGYFLLVRRREGLSQLAQLVLLGVTYLIGGFGLFFGMKALATFFSTGPPEPPEIGGGQGVESPPENGGAGATGGEAIPAAFITLAALCFAAVITYMMFKRKTTETAVGGRGGTTAEPPAPVETGDVAPAIDIEDVPTTNAVYRSWREMATAAVDASDRTVTASEVARAAVTSGFDREAVRTLTDLFEEVRYGGRPVTDERERRAESALSSIEEGAA